MLQTHMDFINSSSNTVPTFNSCKKNAWAARAYYTTARPITTQYPRHGGMDDLTTERSFDLQATWVIYAFGFSF